MTVNILAVGDVVGDSGISFLSRHLPGLKSIKKAAFTVVNGENANTVGITPGQAGLILDAGADVITLGNHTWARREIYDYLDNEPRILRPANFAPSCPGRGYGVFDAPFGKVLVVNLQGRFSMDSNTDNPFLAADRILGAGKPGVILVDMHAEATSERQAMGRYLDGRCAAVWGTHTHVQTSDACVLPKGTGFISDLGMTGPSDSVLGIDPEKAVARFLGNPPTRFTAAKGPAKMECAVFTVDIITGLCLEVEALRIT